MFFCEMEGISKFNTQNFMEDTNFEHLFDLIGDEFRDPIANVCLNYDCEQINGCLDHTQFVTNLGDNFLDGFNLSSTIEGLPLFDNDVREMEEENNIGEESSGTTTTTRTTETKRKGDRSRTLITERRRRGRMKDKLYALRALVPNITKMDKASIVGDAVIYVQELQLKAKKLKAEISELESSLTGQGKRQRNISEVEKTSQIICKKIMQMAMFQVEEKGFYVRMESNRGQGVVVSLYKALESLTRFNVRESNLATLEDKFVLTFTLKVQECEPNVTLENMKLCVTGAFLNQGFEFLDQHVQITEQNMNSENMKLCLTGDFLNEGFEFLEQLSG